jgi:microcystin-dependent protein
MPSTYSTLAIQLMATGENSTTWGNVTNLNLGTALEEAVVGTVDVPFTTADVTLSLANSNASQTARNLRLNLTGTPASDFNLIIPATAGSPSATFEKPYIINNGTGRTITVKHPTGTGVAVPAGKTMWVYANGTNVVDVVTHLSSVTLGTALSITSGGTGGNTAGTARTSLGATTVGANLFTLANPSAITFPRFNADNTISALTASDFRTAIGAGTSSTTGTVTSVSGTGNVNGITLTGTVNASGDLTLGGTLSGVSLSTQTTGTLAVGRGGTGITTTPSNGQIPVGNGTNYVAAAITAGSGISVTNGSGSITIATTNTPAGSVSMFAASTAPAGWLECDGALVSRTTFAALFAVIGTTYGAGDGSTTFAVPDMRGEFPRGWDDGRGVDSGRALGSAQGQSTQAHNHQWWDYTGGAGTTIDMFSPGSSTWDSSGNPAANFSDPFTTDAYTSTTLLNTSGETRPRNIALMFIIKT